MSKIHIKPSKKGTFTAAAKKHGKSVQAFASQVLSHKGSYSPAMVKKANFARNASKWKHEDGGNIDMAPSIAMDNNTMFMGNLLAIKGKKHENGGTPLDIDNDGVHEIEAEDGETMKDNFIISDNIGYDKKGFVTSNPKLVSKTFAEKSKSTENKYKARPEYDFIANQTKEAEHDRIINDNKQVLAVKKFSDTPKAADGFNLLDLLGLGTDSNAQSTLTSLEKGLGNILGTTDKGKKTFEKLQNNGAFQSNPLQRATEIIGNNIPNASPKDGALGGAATGFGKGVAQGMAFGPLGAAFGGVIGAIQGGIQGNQDRQNYYHQLRATAAANSQDDINKGISPYNTFGQFKYGGYLPKAADGGPEVIVNSSPINNTFNPYTAQATPFPTTPVSLQTDFNPLPTDHAQTVPNQNQSNNKLAQAQGLLGLLGNQLQLSGMIPATQYNRNMSKQAAAREPFAYNPYDSQVRGMMASRRYNEQPLVNETNLAFNAGAKAIDLNTNSDAVGRANKVALYSDLASKTQLARLEGQKMNHQYLGESANMLNNLGQQRAAEKIRVSDVNARNLAAKQNFAAKTATQTGQGMTEAGKASNQNLQNSVLYGTLQSMYDKYKLNGETFEDFLASIGKGDILKYNKNGSK